MPKSDVRVGQSCGSNPGSGSKFFFSTKHRTRLRGQPNLLFIGHWRPVLEVKRLGCEVQHSPTYRWLMALVCTLPLPLPFRYKGNMIAEPAVARTKC